MRPTLTPLAILRGTAEVWIRTRRDKMSLPQEEKDPWGRRRDRPELSGAFVPSQGCREMRPKPYEKLDKLAGAVPQVPRRARQASYVTFHHRCTMDLGTV